MKWHFKENEILYVFLFPTNSSASEVGSPDPTRVAAVFAKAVSVAMVPHLKSIKHHGLSPFGVKISLDPENVSSHLSFLMKIIFKWLFELS